MPVVNVFMEKKSTAPNSAKVSIATRDNPATIAGRAAGNIILKNDLNLEKPRFFPKSIKLLALTVALHLLRPGQKLLSFWVWLVVRSRDRATPPTCEDSRETANNE